MSNNISRLGDLSDHGGYIMSVTTTKTYCNGKLIARIGDLHSCPIPGHGITQIISSSLSSVNVEGKNVATIGSKTGCGATIITGSNNTQ